MSKRGPGIPNGVATSLGLHLAHARRHKATVPGMGVCTRCASGITHSAFSSAIRCVNSIGVVPNFGLIVAHRHNKRARCVARLR